MKIGMTVEPVKGVPIKQLLMLLRIVGLDHFEVNTTMMERVDEFANCLKKTPTTFHLPFYDRFHFDMGTTNEEYKERIEEIIVFLNDYKQQLNLKYVLTHPPEDPDSTSDTLIERLDRINCPIIIENIMEQSDEDFMEFYFEVKKKLRNKIVGHAIDGPHRYVTNNETWLQIPEKLLKEIVYVHISDCTKKADLHLPLGCAKLPFNDFFDKLKEINFDGVILQEIIPSLDQTINVLDSILHSVKPFSKRQYLALKLRYTFLKPLTQLKIKSTFRQLRKSGNMLIQDLAYDLGLQH
ncbi:MAG: sugar phosphate isomerase/epimerase [Asgard group archaeon]|nr:sugar phosphate isomerase/epimerase [Asgard group archaeon]